MSTELHDPNVLQFPQVSDVQNIDAITPEQVTLSDPSISLKSSHFAWIASGLTLLALMFGILIMTSIQVTDIGPYFPGDVIIILASLDIFSMLVVQTGILETIGIRLAIATRGKAHIAAIAMAALMFVASAFLNNLAAIFILAPVFLTLLRAMRAKTTVIVSFLSLMLIVCNLGGFATPMGDFPAIMLMSSGLIGFIPYLTLAFPLAATLGLVVITIYGLLIRRQANASIDESEDAQTRVSLHLLQTQYCHVKADWTRGILLGCVFFAMIFAWVIVPQDKWPFFMTAVVGCFVAMLVAGPELSKQAIKNYDLRTILVMSVILLVAAFIAASGVLNNIAELIVATAPNPTLLLFSLMCIAALAAGLFSAGPATAAILPIFMELGKGPLSIYGPWLAVAFAAAICAGSSMFLHSATAGPTLRGEADKAGFIGKNGMVLWNSARYVAFGFSTGLLQLAISIAWIWSANNVPNFDFLVLLPVGLAAFLVGYVRNELQKEKLPVVERPRLGLLIVGALIMATAICIPVATIFLGS